MPNKLDILDRHIIELLQADGRASSAVISRKLNVPERTIRNRIIRMIEHEVIRPTVVVDHKLFGYKIAVDIFCEIDINKFEEIGQALMQFHEVNYIAYATGDQDISIQVLLESSDAIYEFTQKLVKIPGIHRSKTVVVPRILKNTFEWIPPEDDFEEYGGDLSPN